MIKPVVIHTGKWIRNHPDDSPARKVILFWEGNCCPYSTHIQVGDNFFWGHYFTTESAAVHDFYGRNI